jgi:hypothetical protein
MYKAGAIMAASLLLFGCNANRQLQREHETAAILQIKQIGQAQTMYYSQFGRYAANLGDLGPSVASLISKDVSSARYSGYVFTLVSTPAGFAVTAVPETPESGTRTFYSDESMVIRSEAGATPAGAASPELK